MIIITDQFRRSDKLNTRSGFIGIFDSIKEKLLDKKAAEPVKAGKTANAPAAAETSAKTGKMADLFAAKTAAATAPAAAAPAAAATAAPAAPVDIEAVIEEMVKAKGVKLNWRESIVDLLKALDLDSSLAARKELAKDLNYSGPHADGTAEKNIWLHKEVMKTLAANGGKVPAALLK